MSDSCQTPARDCCTVWAVTHIRRARDFFARHTSGCFVLPNAWDAASAATIAVAGATAIGTTSSGISWARGVRDGEGLCRHEAIDALAAIANTVALPVSADLESGYGSAPSDVAATIEAATQAGAVGANIEDRLHPNGDTLWSIAEQCERLAAARAAADTSGAPFVLNARTDIYLASVGEPEEREALVLERADHYRVAGADCLFVPGLNDVDTIARIVKASPLPINAMIAPGDGPSIVRLAEVGVRRVSTGHTIAALLYATARRATAELLEGSETALHGGIPATEMQALMARPAC